MRLKKLLSTIFMIGISVGSMVESHGASTVLAEAGGIGVRLLSRYAVSGVRMAAGTQARHYATKTHYKPWQHLPMEAVVRDVRYDETFKILLGEEGAESRAISFLNAVFQPKTEGDRVKAIRYLDGTLNSAVDRTLHFDVKIEGLCETYTGHRFIVEMQKARIPAHTNRWVYYGARELAAMGERNYRMALAQITEEAKKKAHKEHYQRLDPVRVVTVLDFDSPATGSELHNAKDVLVHWDICERQSKRIASPLLSWTYVLLPRFVQGLPVKGSLDFRGRPLDAWLYLMTREDREKVIVTKELVSDEEAVAEGFHRVSHLTEAEAESLHAGQMAFSSRISRELEKFSEGEQKGMAKGRIEGQIDVLKGLIEDGTTTLDDILKSSRYSEEVKQKLRELLSSEK